MFFCAETPEDIVTLLEGYPEFQKLYGEIYELCRNVEKVIGMFFEGITGVGQEYRAIYDG